MKTKGCKRGISLIVLIITIIVVIILAAVVILTISKNNPIESAKEANFKEDVRTFQDELNMYISNEYQRLAGQRDNKITATAYEKDSTSDEYNNSVYKYLGSFKKKYEEKLIIQDDKIVYIGTDKKEQKYSEEMNIKTAKILTIKFLDGNGNAIKNDEVITLVDNVDKLSAPQIDNYMALIEEVKIDDNIEEVIFEYLPISYNLMFEGLASNGNATTDENDIVCYMVSGIGECNSPYIAIPRVYKNKPVIKIKQNAFEGKTNIEKVVIGDNITEIGDVAFYNCTKLKSLNVNAKKIKSWAFNNAALEYLLIGENVETIENVCFTTNNYRNLNIIFNTSKAEINKQNMGAYNQYRNYIIKEDNTKYKVVDRVIYSKDDKAIYMYPDNGEDGFEIPIGIEKIKKKAFSGCNNLTQIEIPNTVKTVEPDVFMGCQNLTKVIWKGENISSYAFEGSKVKVIDIKSSVKKIEDLAFYNANSIKEINYEGTKEEWNNLSKSQRWNEGLNDFTVHCSDGDISF